MSVDTTEYLELLYQALHSPLGLVLSVSSFAVVQQRLYTARRSAGDPDLDRLQFRHSPYSPETELWLVKGAPKTAALKELPDASA